MYKLNIKKENFSDLIILLLFDKLLDENFLDNEIFNKLSDVLQKKGLKSKLFSLYFDINPNLRSKYKQFKKSLVDDSVIINVSNSKNEDYKMIIEETIKVVTKKNNPNPKKVKEVTEQILNSIEKEIL